MTVHPRVRRWGSSRSHVDLSRSSEQKRVLHLDAHPQNLSIDVQRSAVIVVDMQNDFCSAGGWLSSIGVDISPARSALGPLKNILPALREAGIPVIWLNWSNRPDLANLPPNVTHVYDADGTGGGIGAATGLSEAVLTEGSWGASIVDELDVAPADIHVGKFRMSGFFDTALDSILRNLAVDTVFFAGVNADQCVLATLTDAACLGYDVVLVEGATATTSPEFCMAATLYNVRQCFGFTTTAEQLTTAIHDEKTAREEQHV